MMSAHSTNSRHGLRIEPEALLRHLGDELRARPVIGIVELRVAGVLLEVRGVLRRQERALMVIEPPRDSRRWRVLEVDDGILVAGEVFLVEQRTGAMHQSNVLELDVLADAFAIEPRKKRRRTGSVKTLVVVKDPYLHRPFPMPPAPATPDCSSWNRINQDTASCAMKSR